MEASALIPAQCPNCGGKLNVDPGTDILTCPYCSTEHIIRRETGGGIHLEAFARCPLCKRNDQVEKASAIIHKQTSHSNTSVPQQEVYTDKDGHVQSRTVYASAQSQHSTSLARKLFAPDRPAAPKLRHTWGMALLLLAAAYVFFNSVTHVPWEIQRMISRHHFYFADNIVRSVFSLLAMFFLIFVWVVLARTFKKSNKRQTAAHAQALEGWKQARARWDSLYYCGRDDVVFIPGEKTCVNVNDMTGYLYAPPAKAPSA